MSDISIVLTEEEKGATLMLLAAGVSNIGGQIAQGGFAAIEDGRASALLNVAVAVRAKLLEAKSEDVAGG